MTPGDVGELVYLSEPRTVEIREYPVPEPEHGAVVTEVVRTNVCGSDVHVWRGDVPGLSSGTFGHEAVCRVTALGEGVDSDYAGRPVEEGDLVVPVYFGTCQRCSSCRRGEFHDCQNAFPDSGPVDEPPHFEGTFGSHYYISPDQYFYKVPDGLDPGIAATANCALSQVRYGLDRIGLEPGDTLVVQGGGGLGINALAVADTRGVTTILVEGVDGRIDTALDFGVDHVVDFREYETVDERAARVAELTSGNGADVAIEVAGTPEVFAEGVELLRHNGRYLVIGNGFPGNTTAFDPAMIVSKSLTVSGVVRYQPWYLDQSLEFLEEHGDQFPYERLHDAEFSLTDAGEALEKSANREITRATLRPDPDE